LNHVRISTLRLHKNHLGDDAMEAIAEHITNAAEDGQPLMELHLSNNQISEVGIATLIKAAQQSGAYVGKRDKRPDGREDHRHAALWLRTENQRPAISDPQGFLDRLDDEGFTVCLLPSKEWTPPAGKGKGSLLRPDASVHMHHSFVRRDRKVNDEWEDREDKNNGKGKSNHGKAGQEDWGIATSERNKGKGGGKAESHDDFGKGGKAGKGDKGYNFEGKGRSNSKGWRNMWEAEQWAQDHSAWGAWGSRGYGDMWNDWEDEDYDEDVPQYRSRQQESSRKGRYDQSENWEKAEPDRKGRRSKDWEQDGEDPSSRHSYDDRNGSPSRKSNQWYKQEQDTGSSMQGSFGGDVVSSPWLLTAAADVYKKIKACQALEVLKRSLSPGKVAEPEWLQI